MWGGEDAVGLKKIGALRGNGRRCARLMGGMNVQMVITILRQIRLLLDLNDA